MEERVAAMASFDSFCKWPAFLRDESERPLGPDTRHAKTVCAASSLEPGISRVPTASSSRDAARSLVVENSRGVFFESVS